VATRQHDPDPYDPRDYVEAVLDLVERIPAGRVMSYGAIAEYLAPRFARRAERTGRPSGRGSARRVGTIMAQHGGSVAWHRVVTASGRTPPGHEEAARRLLTAEEVTFRGDHVDMAVHAWFPS